MIRVENLTITAGSFRLANVDLELGAGEYGVLMGRTGSGKTTLLEALCGLRKVSGGRILLGGRDVTHARPAERGIGYVPQDGALFDHMKIHKQIGFALRIRKRPRAETDERVKQLAELLNIEHLLNRRPYGLSGGEKQRIALGRALAHEPQILLLDEPLAALDDETRFQIEALLRDVQRRLGVTALHITHNLSEAQRLADRLFRIEDGRLIEIDKNAPPSLPNQQLKASAATE